MGWLNGHSMSCAVELFNQQDQSFVNLTPVLQLLCNKLTQFCWSGLNVEVCPGGRGVVPCVVGAGLVGLVGTNVGGEVATPNRPQEQYALTNRQFDAGLNNGA